VKEKSHSQVLQVADSEAPSLGLYQ